MKYQIETLTILKLSMQFLENVYTHADVIMTVTMLQSPKKDRKAICV
jgi:hypothetical protein